MKLPVLTIVAALMCSSAHAGIIYQEEGRASSFYKLFDNLEAGKYNISITSLNGGFAFGAFRAAGGWRMDYDYYAGTPDARLSYAFDGNEFYYSDAADGSRAAYLQFEIPRTAYTFGGFTNSFHETYLGIPAGLPTFREDIFRGSMSASFRSDVGEIDYQLTFSTAPEPSIWALMILGFGTVGASLRRRAALA